MNDKNFANMEHTILAKCVGNATIEFIHANPDVARYSTLRAVPLARYNDNDLIEAKIEVLPSGVRKVRSTSFVRVTAQEWLVANQTILDDEFARWQSMQPDNEQIAPQPVVSNDARTNDASPVAPKQSNDKRIWISDRDSRLLETMHRIANASGLAKILFVGPSGYGKSSIPEQKARDWGMSFLRWDCATVRDPEEFFGFRGARNGSTQNDDGENLFTPSAFTEALMRGNAVILLDELSRLDPSLANVLFPILDDAKKINVAGHEITLGDNIVICASINVGFQYTGTFTLDEALRNRFDVFVEVGPLPTDVEIELAIERNGIDRDNAQKCVVLMSKLRTLNKNEMLDIDASTRTTLALTRLIANGLAPHDAIFYTLISGIEQSQRTEVINASAIEFGTPLDM